MPPYMFGASSGATKLDSSASFFYLGANRRHDLKQVANHGVIGFVQDGRFGVGVDGENMFRALGADHVLNRAAHAARCLYLFIRAINDFPITFSGRRRAIRTEHKRPLMRYLLVTCPPTIRVAANHFYPQMKKPFGGSWRDWNWITCEGVDILLNVFILIRQVIGIR